jgi:hypothetical protein
VRFAGVVGTAAGTVAVAAIAVLVVHAASGSPAGTGPPASPARRGGTVSQAPALPAVTGGRRLPGPLYGVTVDDTARLGRLVRSLRHLRRMPTTRIVFNVSQSVSHYAAAVRALRPASYLMGELLDSSDETLISTAALKKRVKSYLAAFGDKIDLWEIGNEVNGDWTGRHSTVSDKLTNAYREVNAAGDRTALTLYYNVGCHDGAAELSPLAFSRRYVPRAIRTGLDYVFLSYYEDDCNGRRPKTATWTAYFRKLHNLYPHALLGFGEIGMNDPAARKTTRAARSLIRYYYGLSIKLPDYVGGYFWWYYAEDCVPYRSKPLWTAMRTAFKAEATSPR